MTAAAPLTPMDRSRTVRRPSFRGRAPQVWGAVSADGRWTYQRLEQAGTPWVVLDADGAEWGATWFGTLDRARKATARHDSRETTPCPSS